MACRRHLATIALFALAEAAFAIGASRQARANDAAGTVEAPAAAPAPAPAPADPRTRFAGTFRFVGDSREEAARRAAIDRAIDSLFFAIRPIARSRLTSGTKVSASYSFSFEPGKIRVRVPSIPDAVSADSGAWGEFVHDGEKSKLSQRFVGGKLAQVFNADEGSRTNEFTLSPDGTSLTLKVIISSPKLSTPVVYLLSYKKAG
jgi:hypothetical protein